MNLQGPYTFYILAAYAAALVLLGGAGLSAWYDWRRVRDAWARVNGRGGRAS